MLTDIPSDGVPEPEKEDPGEELDQKEESEEESEKDLPEEIIPKEKSPEPVISIPEVSCILMFTFFSPYSSPSVQIYVQRYESFS